MNDIDIAAYLERIGHRGATAPTYATLAALHRLHPAAIPFENLDPFLARPIDLGPQALQDQAGSAEARRLLLRAQSAFHAGTFGTGLQGFRACGPRAVGPAR